MSNKIHIRVSGIWIDWDLFTAAMKLFSDPKTYMLCGCEALYIHLKDINVLPKIFLLAHAKDFERARVQNNQPKPKLLSLPLNLWITRASDGRDIIYGLLNLCSDGTAQSLVPSYDKDFTVEALFAKFGELCLQREELGRNWLPTKPIHSFLESGLDVGPASTNTSKQGIQSLW